MAKAMNFLAIVGILLAALGAETGFAQAPHGGAPPIPPLFVRIHEGLADTAYRHLAELSNAPPSKPISAWILGEYRNTILAADHMRGNWPGILSDASLGTNTNQQLAQMVLAAQFYFSGRTPPAPTSTQEFLSFPAPYAWEQPDEASSPRTLRMRRDWEFPELRKGGVALRLTWMDYAKRAAQASEPFSWNDLYYFVDVRCPGFIAGIGRPELDEFVQKRETEAFLDFVQTVLGFWRNQVRGEWSKTVPDGVTAAEVYVRFSRCALDEVANKMARHPEHFNTLVIAIAEQWKNRLERLMKDGMDEEDRLYRLWSMTEAIKVFNIVRGDVGIVPVSDEAIEHPVAKIVGQDLWRVICAAGPERHSALLWGWQNDLERSPWVPLDGLDLREGDVDHLFRFLANHASRTNDRRLQRILFEMVRLCESPGTKK